MKRRASYLTGALFGLLLAATFSALALDAAPYTEAAARRLDQAARQVEAPRPATDDTEDLRRKIRYFDEIYQRAGYSFEKSLMRFSKELVEDGIPPLTPYAQTITVAYRLINEARERKAQLDKVLGPTMAKQLIADFDAIDTKEAERKKTAAAERKQEQAARDAELGRQRAESEAQKREQAERQQAAKAEEDDRRRQEAAALAQSWADWSSDHYVARNEPETFVDLKYTGGNLFVVAGQRNHAAMARSDPDSSCTIPEVEVSMVVRGSDLEGDTMLGSCKVTVRLTQRRQLQVYPRGGDACNALCSSGRMQQMWLQATWDQAGRTPSRREAAPSRTTPTAPSDRAVTDFARRVFGR
jgi:hypothetical protein